MKNLILSLKFFLFACFALHFFSACSDDSAADVTYTVTFDTGTGSAIESVIVNAGEAVEQPADPTPESDDYTFDTWYKEADFSTIYNFEDLVTEDITIYANYTAVPIYTVEYYYIDNTSSAISLGCDEYLKEGTVLSSAPESIEATVLDAEYTYVNEWYTDEALSEPYEFGAAINKDCKLYSKVKATVTFDLNGGASSAPIEDQVVDLNTYLTQSPTSGISVWHLTNQYASYNQNWNTSTTIVYGLYYDNHLITKNTTLYVIWASY